MLQSGSSIVISETADCIRLNCISDVLILFFTLLEIVASSVKGLTLKSFVAKLIIFLI